MSIDQVREIEPSNTDNLKKFVLLESEFHSSNPLFIQETVADVIKNLSGQSVIFNDMIYTLFVASNGNRDVARCAALINPKYQKAKNESVGFIGFFAAAADSESQVQMMFDQAEMWLKKQGVNRVIAGYNGSGFTGTMGILTTAFDEEPMYPFGWHPPYYQQYFVNSGYDPSYPFWFYTIPFSSEKYRAVVNDVRSNNTVKVRPIDKKNWDADLETYRQVFNKGFEEEWEFYPHTNEEFHDIYDEFKLIIDPRQLLLAEVGGKTAGFCWGLPDINPLLRSFKGKIGLIQFIKLLWGVRRFRRAGLLAIGVLPEYKGTGVAQALATTLYKRYEEHGLQEAFYYPVNESNLRSRRFAEKLGGKGRVLYHCFDKRL